ncbi:MAG: TIGR04283 family arsenosugar biosynthesis glycosyltransferase [Desulfobacterales bacterium]|nr:TIGR04283 family arsenosugar biosynthesis glycosyltransferase [Desulfobacterales bacterium]
MQLSIIIPVFKEQESIQDTLNSLAASCIPISHEILVVDGEPSASTLAFLESNPVFNQSIRMIRSAQGRGPQMNKGAKEAKGELLLFLHADSRLNAAGMSQMVTTWMSQQSKLFCGAFDLAIDSNRTAFRLIEKTASIRSRLTRIPYGDQGIFISRALFEKVGGYPNQPLMEDVGLMAAIKQIGIKPVFLDQKILTSARRWEKKGVVLTTLFNWFFITLYGLGVSPKRLSRWYYG